MWQWHLQRWPEFWEGYENNYSTQFSSVLSIVPSYTHHSPPSWNKPKDCEGDNFFTLIITIISRHTLPSEIPGNPLDPYLSTYSCADHEVDHHVDHQGDHHVDHQGDHHGPTLKRWWLCCTPPPPLPPSRPPLPWNDDVFMVKMKRKRMFSNNDISRDVGMHITNSVLSSLEALQHPHICEN